MANFEEIYRQYFHPVYRFALSLSRNEEIAQEITQETFYKALKSINSFQGTCKMNVWLCQIAKNTYFSYLDRQKRQHSPLETADAEQNTAQGADLPMASLLEKETVFRIHQALHQLPEPYKEVFTLRVFGELSFQQIGQLFQKTESWARVTYYRGKQKIQALLKEELS